MAYNPGAYTAIPSGFVFFITTTVIDWVDIFTREEYRRIIAQSLEFCRKNKGLNIHAWVLMSNHLHLIVSHDEGKEKLTQVIADFKKFTSKNILKTIIDNDKESRKHWLLHHFDEEHIMRNPDASCAKSHEVHDKADTSPAKQYHLWQRGFDSYEIKNIAHLRQKIDYLHANPVRAGLVHANYEYLYSSARNYSGEPSLFDIDEVSLGLTPSSRSRRH